MHAQWALTAVVTKKVISGFTKATVRSSCACRSSSLSCCLGIVVDRETGNFSPAVCTRCILGLSIWPRYARLPHRRFRFGFVDDVESAVVGAGAGMEKSCAIRISWPGVRDVEGMGGSGGNKAGRDVVVPLPMHGVAGKYATALYVTAVHANALDPVRGDLEQVAGVAGMDTLFAGFMRDPSVPKPARVKACEEIFKETKFHEVTKNFMAVLAENGRLAFMPRIFSLYCELLLASRGEVNVQVTTASELSAAELEDIKKTLSGAVTKNQNAKITQKVDRSIIAGIVVTVGDKIIDLSIDRTIKLMEKLLAEPV